MSSSQNLRFRIDAQGRHALSGPVDVDATIPGLAASQPRTGEFVAHDSSPQFGSLNHGSPANRNAPGPTLVRGLRTGADINQPAISAKTLKMALS
jgi:hypothetical protein